MGQAETLSIQRVLAGDQTAFEQLMDKYKPLVKGKLMNMLRRPDEVDDLVQDVFCRAYQELPALRQPDQFGSWLWRITTNTAMSWWRRHQRQVNPPDIYAGQVICPPDQAFEQQEELARLWARLHSLPAPYRRVLNLYVQGCSYKEIAQYLGITLPAVKWRMLEGRRHLRRALVHRAGA